LNPHRGDFAVLKALGVRVRRVKDLQEGSLFVEDRRILFLDHELTDEQINDAIEWTLPLLWAPAE